MPAQYDFRDGILLEKVVYKDDSCDCGGGWLFFLCLVLTWGWGVAWFALFFYCYINYEKTTMWVFITLWLIHFAVLITIGALTLIRAKNDKINKQKKKEELAKEQEAIEQARRKRNQNRKGSVNSNNYVSPGLINPANIEMEDMTNRRNNGDLITPEKNMNNNENSDRILNGPASGRNLFDNGNGY